jgi:hypothetical protein
MGADSQQTRRARDSKVPSGKLQVTGCRNLTFKGYVRAQVFTGDAVVVGRFASCNFPVKSNYSGVSRLHGFFGRVGGVWKFCNATDVHTVVNGQVLDSQNATVTLEPNTEYVFELGDDGSIKYYLKVKLEMVRI